MLKMFSHNIFRWFLTTTCFDIFLCNGGAPIISIIFIYLFMGVLGLRFCARAFSSCGKRGPLFIAVRGPLTVAASLVAERRLSNYGSRAQLLCGMWDLPRPGLEPVSPALAGRFSTTAPPAKPYYYFLSLFILAALGLRCCAQAFSSCSERGLLFIAVHGLLIAVASHCGAQALGARSSVVVARGL